MMVMMLMMIMMIVLYGNLDLSFFSKFGSWKRAINKYCCSSDLGKELLLNIAVVLLVDNVSTESEAAPSRCDESLTKAANTKQCERSKATKLNAMQ